MQVYLNGQKQDKGMPFFLSYVTPGEYTLTVTKDGYQKWERLITVDPNKTYKANDIFLILASSTPTSLPSAPLVFPSATPADIQVKNNNEIWIQQTFITRTSEDIYAIQWFPDNDHLVYQAGNTIWFCDADGLSTQKIATLPTSDPITFTFLNKGQTLVYQQATGDPIALRLF